MLQIKYKRRNIPIKVNEQKEIDNRVINKIHQVNYINNIKGKRFKGEIIEKDKIHK